MSRYGILKSKKFKEHLNQRRYEREVEERLEEERIQEQTRQRQISEKIEKEKRKLQETFESLKSDWRSELSPQEEQVEIVEELKIKVPEKLKSNWRKELNEGMTSSGMFFTTLNPPNDTYNNPIVTTPTTTISHLNAINSSTRLITLGTFNLSTIQQFQVNATRLGSGGDSYGWALQANGTVIAAGGESDPIRVASAAQLAIFGSGNVTLTLRQSTIPAFGDNATSSSVTGWTINGVNFFRTTPVNVFVSLDSPEASAFIRTDPIMANLSPQERLQKLKEMLEASDEYVMKMLGFDFPGTGAVPPGEYDPFTQAPPGEAGDTPGVDITDYGTDMTPLSNNPYGTEVGQISQTTPSPTGGGQMPYGTPGGEKPFARQGYKDSSGKFIDFDDPSTWPSMKNQLKQAGAGNYNQIASYQPQGEVISEKRKLKSPQEILSKIPGYYDGKPAPLGFPVEPPPKMVNGMHPDLVDGKKVADRFNRLDPQSAQAMPLTGNPHIDKKVLKARKQPK